MSNQLHSSSSRHGATVDNLIVGVDVGFYIKSVMHKFISILYINQIKLIKIKFVNQIYLDNISFSINSIGNSTVYIIAIQ